MKKSIMSLIFIVSWLFALSASADTLYLLDGSYAEFDKAAADKLLQGAGWYKEPMIRMENERGNQRRIVPIEESYTLTGFTKINSIPLLDRSCNVIYVESEEAAEQRDEELRMLADPGSEQKTTRKKRLYTKDKRLAVEVKPSWVDVYLTKGWHLPVTIYYPDGTTKELLDFEKDEAVKNGGYEEPVLYVYKENGEKKIIFQRDTEAAKADGWATSKYITAYNVNGEKQLMTEEQERASDEWYPYPVTRLFHVDGRVAAVADSEREKYLKDDWYTIPMRYVYAPNQSYRLVGLDDVPSWEAVGWYSYPVMTVYAEDGRERIIPTAEYDAWNKVGWYRTPVVRMFSAYNPSVVIAVSETAEWEAAGWSYVPMTLIHSVYGERAAVPLSEADKWREYGWYSSGEEALYMMLSCEYDEYVSDGQIFEAMLLMRKAIEEKVLAGTVYEQYLYRMKAAMMDELRTYLDMPVLITGANTDTSPDGEKVTELWVENLSYKKVLQVSYYCEFADTEGKGTTITRGMSSGIVAIEPGCNYILTVPRYGIPSSYDVVYAYPEWILYDDGTFEKL